MWPSFNIRKVEKTQKQHFGELLYFPISLEKDNKYCCKKEHIVK